MILLYEKNYLANILVTIYLLVCIYYIFTCDYWDNYVALSGRWFLTLNAFIFDSLKVSVCLLELVYLMGWMDSKMDYHSVLHLICSPVSFL